jgi:hypothetical protein
VPIPANKSRALMLVSHRHQFIYTKTFKTASTSVEIYFEDACLPQGRGAVDRHRIAETVSAAGIVGRRGAGGPSAPWYNHMPASLIRERLGDEIWRRYFKFCVIRNPFEKLVSQYWFSMPVARKAAMAVWPQQAIQRDFATWLMAGAAGVLDRDLYFIDGSVCVDFFIRHESLLEGIEEVCRKVGLPFAPDNLGHYKSEPHPVGMPTAAYYDHAGMAIVENLFDWELAHFGYALGPDGPSAS